MEDTGDESIEAFGMDCYDEAISLWTRTPGMGLSPADDRKPMTVFLKRNPGLSFAAWSGSTLVGTILCGTDGRRGFLYHLAVDSAYRRRGLGTRLVSRSLSALKTSGIDKCHLFVIAENASGAAFWEAAGWILRKDILTYSKNT
jgi:ribosomal protein S18 acetylase RimI-like enzyme